MILYIAEWNPRLSSTARKVLTNHVKNTNVIVPRPLSYTFPRQPLHSVVPNSCTRMDPRTLGIHASAQAPVCLRIDKTSTTPRHS
jgi:hypothetical protein